MLNNADGFVVSSKYGLANELPSPKLLPVIIPVPPFSGVADGKRNIVGAFGFSVQGGVLKHIFNSLRAVAAQPEPHALTEAEVFPAFVLPAVTVIIHALQFRVGVKGFL